MKQVGNRKGILLLHKKGECCNSKGVLLCTSLRKKRCVGSAGWQYKELGDVSPPGSGQAHDLGETHA